MISIKRLLAVFLLAAVPLMGAQALAGEGRGKAKGHDKKDRGTVVTEPEPEPSPTGTDPEADASDKPHGQKPRDPKPAKEPKDGPKGGSDPGEGPGGEPGAPELVVGSHTKELLVQVGAEINYTVTVGNPGDAPLDEVIVLDLVPPEVHVLGVANHPEVEAVQLGRANGKEDIVWNVGTLDPGQTLELKWVGIAAKAGDLEAVNSVRAKAAQARDDAEGTSYLGALEDREVRNPPFKPIKKKVVTYSRPTITKVLAAPPVVGGVLPVTGAEPVPWLVLSVMLMVAGACALLLARIGPARHHVVALAALALLTTACVSDEKTPSVTTAPAPSDSTESEGSPDDDAGDRVLGNRLNRDKDKNKSDEETTTDGSEGELPIATPEPQVVEVLGDPVRTVEIVEVTLADLETDDVESRPGDNHLTYEWNADSTSITRAASSRVVVRGQALELLTSVHDNDGDIDIVVTLRNLSDSKRARVHGRLIHEVFGSSGSIATFQSPLIDTVLDPGGETTATFTYMLPTGSYSAEGSFQAA